MAYRDFKDLPRRTTSDKELHDKAFNIAKNPKYDGDQCRIPLMAYKFFDKKSSGGAVTRAQSETLATQDKSAIKSEAPNQQLQKPIIRKCKKCEVYSFF